MKNEHEKSFLEELEKWRKDYNVTDDSVAKVLNRKSRELSNAKKESQNLGFFFRVLKFSLLHHVDTVPWHAWD